ncbi:mRNA capping enzyme, large subunit [Neoconidiobolus thromboides FSU 785]|nr:mRNA capping enzyme, large subunit [Neoconidiobolus thromboides FSU 785]
MNHQNNEELETDKSGKIETIANEVAQHYNSRPDLGLQKRKESVILNLRSYNNWVKSILINKYVQKNSVVLDIGCGKGGDLLKFGKKGIKNYIGADIASVSIEQARERYNSMRYKDFPAQFFVHDCYGKLLKPILPSNFSADAISMQFCMHYAFETEEKVRMMLTNVSQNLNKGGHFFATIPNSNWIVKKIKNSNNLEFGNKVYKIRFETKDLFTIYGHKYYFELQDAIEDCPEYLVHFPTFEKLAREYGLKLIFKMDFHNIYKNFSNVNYYNELLYRMNVISEDTTSIAYDFDNNQWEACGIYLAVAFEKV